MKKIYHILFAVIFSATINAQDIIVKTNNEEIAATKIEINENDIRYKKVDDPTITFLLFKKDVKSIKFKNGELMEFADTNITLDSVKQTNLVTGADLNNSNLNYKKGQQDAQKYYTNYKTAGTVTLVASILSPLAFGLGTAMGTAFTPPQDYNLGYPNQNLMKNEDYASGYKEKAKSIKSKKVWRNFYIGAGAVTATSLVFIMAIVASTVL